MKSLNTINRRVSNEHPTKKVKYAESARGAQPPTGKGPQATGLGTNRRDYSNDY